MEFVNCIICNSNNQFQLIETVPDRFNVKEYYDILKCDCGMIMLNPRPDKLEISQHYSSLDYQPHHKKKNLFNFIYKIGQLFNNRSKKIIITKYFNSGALLDFGGGDGQFSNFIKNNKWDSVYYEPYLEKKEDAHLNNIESLNNKKFNVITMFHSIEHIHDVHKSLEKIYNLLYEKGILVLSFPNYNAYDRRFLNNRWIAYDAPRHLYHFEINSINNLLEQKGFKILENKAVYLDTFYNIIMSYNKIYERILLAPFQIFISICNILINKNAASSILLVCIKK